ncbi:MAG: hypothetical protein NAG76_06905 [Candidatus Pristimantibacillus lignocellulolyticus]|uniref:BIG2 domain-containing protein n=1 Tax=Candidatus Pristimantibacillus lignocellulolyticus TaxID=2994561 RepID=A0A9J6ZIB3_9BACL|nr:MAG: hypothetical protein NAG76_06905 [Candidatus Pristimantibacillus lignocellulolyticus]
MLDRWIVSLRQGQKWLAAALVITLITTSMTGIAYAADEKVTGIEFEYESSEYNSSTSSFELFVEEDKVNVSVLSTISGSTSKKDVTTLATWKSSNTSYVKVDKGVLTGVGKGTATISATYKDYKISIKATSDYVYDSVTLMQNDKAAPAKAEVEIGQSLIYTLDGSKDSVIEDITSEATWTTSNSSIAKVDDGTIELVGTGNVTITAKLKGKSDSISLVVSSPYKSISISPDKQLELEVGEDDKKLEAIAVPKAGGTMNITDTAVWTSANPNIASIEKGKVKPVSPGKTTITVSHLGVTASIEVVVRTAYQSIKLSPEKEYHMLLQDKPLQIKAEVLNNSNISNTVTTLADWTTSDIVVATVENGLVTPKAVGTTKITASYKGVSRSIDVTVYPSVTGITLDVESIDSFANSSGDLPAVSGKLFDGSKVDVSKLVQWSSKDESIAVIEKGKWSTKELGKTVLTAKIANYEVDVELIVHVKPLKIVTDVKELSVILGKDTPYPSVIVINEDGDEEDISKKVKWKTSSDNLLLKTDSIKGLEASTVTLTATYLNKSTTVKVRIEEEIVKLVAEPTSLELNPNRSKSIKVTGYYKDGRSVVLSSKINWTVSPSTLASVKGSTIKALQVGTGIVSGSYQGISIAVPIKVTPKIKSLSLSDKSAKLAPGGTFTVKLTANYTTGNPVVVTEAAVWTTNKASVATVKDGKITAVGKGSATIKATFDGKSTTIRVTVK